MKWQTYGMNPWKLEGNMAKLTHGHEGSMEVVFAAWRFQVVVAQAERVLSDHIASESRPHVVDINDFATFLTS